jgi:two-component system response regulator FlrC
VRELQNVIQRALVLSNDDLITENELMFDEIEQRQAPQSLPASTQSHLMQYGPREVSEAHQLNASALGDLSTAVKSSEYQVIMAAIQSTRNRNEAAKKLGISPRSLRYKMAQFRELGMTANAATNSMNGMIGMNGMHGMAAA